MKLININIQKDTHLERVLPFIERERPDVLCLQEVCEENLPLFETLGYCGEFLPVQQRETWSSIEKSGTALLARHPMQNYGSYYYHGSQDMVCNFNGDAVMATQQKSVLHADIVIESEIFTIGTTHFTWTPDGSTATVEQVTDMEKFLAYVSRLKPHVMCGDFNIPRHHNPLYNELRKHYTDAVPEKYTSSLDRTYHIVGNLPDKQILFDSYMVDYVFTQPPHHASDVRLEFGLSDHAGVVATITKD